MIMTQRMQGGRFVETCVSEGNDEIHGLDYV